MELNHNVSEHEDKGGFTPIPEGTYHMMVVGEEMESDQNSETGHHLKLIFQFDSVDHPSLINRTQWHRLRLWHHNGNWEKTREIARAQLSSLCLACGIDGELKNTDELKLIGIDVTLVHREYQGKTNTEIKSFKARAGSEPATGADFLASEKGGMPPF